MERKLLIVLLVATLGLGALSFVQWRALQTERARSMAMERAWKEEATRREDDAARAREAAARNDQLQRENQEFSAVTTKLRTVESTRQKSAQAAAKAGLSGFGQGGGTNGGMFGKGMGQMLSTMMKNPEMRKMLRGQQQAAVEMMYSGFIKDMKLTPEEKARFTELQLDSQMRKVEGASGLFGGDSGNVSDADLAAAKEATKKAQEATDASLKELLGDDRFAQYEDYQKNINERMQLTQLESQFAAANLPLQPQQSAEMLQIMKEERDRVPPAIPNSANASPAELKSFMTAENIDRQLQWMDQYNQRVLERSASLLSNEQWQKYKEIQEQQVSLQKLGLKMAQEMFGKGGAGGNAAP